MQAILARDLRSAYLLGQQQQVKLLLNQDDPAAIARLMTYYGYFTRARADRIRGIKSTLDELTMNEQEVSEQKSALEKLNGGANGGNRADSNRGGRKERKCWPDCKRSSSKNRPNWPHCNVMNTICNGWWNHSGEHSGKFHRRQHTPNR